ncbi:MAG: hypothetical protein U9N06_05270 [candidate division WOR-3 bacterium]|nr:hypothetical protein [candidate division WOR-3 bacterium]
MVSPEFFDTNAIKDIKVLIIDTAVVQDMVLILSTLGRDRKIPPPLITDTSWVDEMPDFPGWFIAKGEASIYEYEHHSWLAAERNARVSLATFLEYHEKALKKLNNKSLSGVSLGSVNVVVSRVQVLARYINRKNGYCSVLVGMRK